MRLLLNLPDNLVVSLWGSRKEEWLLVGSGMVPIRFGEPGKAGINAVDDTQQTPNRLAEVSESYTQLLKRFQMNR